MGGDDLDVKTVITSADLKGSGSPGELQRVAHVYIGADEYWVYAPGLATGRSIEWLWNLTVRTPFSTDVPEVQRILVLKYVQDKLNEEAAPSISSAKQGKFKKPLSIVGAFNKYTVGETIKKGNSGTVFSVVNEDGERFALKVLTQSAEGKPLARFRNEINFCAVERSRHIIRVLEYGRTDQGFVFYVMPYYRGTLRDSIEKGISANDVLPLYSQILDGVEAAHLLAVLHRDIKPENILHDSTQNILVVADFGISRFKRNELLDPVNTAPHEKLANFVYAAPEQRAIGKKVDYRADIYALGLVLNEMFTREVPQGTGFKRIGDVAPAFDYLDQLVELMIRQNPDERPRSIRAIKEELIGRKNEFIRLQQLDALKTKVIPESEINDPLLSDPIHAVEKLDYDSGVLTLRLNKPVNREWEACFRHCARGYSLNVSQAQISFAGDKVMLRADSHFLQKLTNYFKENCGPANDEYARRIKEGHSRQIAMARASLSGEITRREARERILRNTTL